MSALGDYAENKIIDQIWRGRQWTAPTRIDFALYTAAPGESGGGTEVSGGSYARAQVTTGDSAFNATQGGTPAAASSGTGGSTANAGTINFATPTGAWGNVVAMAAHEGAPGTGLITYATLAQAKTINNGDPAPSFAAGAFTFTVG
jgi:hypothetical protein